MMAPNIFGLACLVVLAVSINAQCQYSSQDGNYNAEWYMDPANTVVHFKIAFRLRTPDSSMWTGIGFGERMLGADIITVSAVNGQIFFADRQGVGYAEPILDSQQDVQNFIGRIENGFIHAEFTRAVDTGDSQDLPLRDLNKNNCQDFIFPFGGGPASQTDIQKHTITPAVQRVCRIDQCSSFPGGPAGTRGNGSAGIVMSAGLIGVIVAIVMTNFLI